MKIAIPLFKDRVAPHFGATSQVLLVEIKQDTIHQQAEWDVGGRSPMDIARRLLDLGIDKIICGGISRFCKEWLVNKGVRVEDNRKGEASEIVRSLLEDRGEPFDRQ